MRVTFFPVNHTALIQRVSGYRKTFWRKAHCVHVWLTLPLPWKRYQIVGGGRSCLRIEPTTHCHVNHNPFNGSQRLRLGNFSLIDFPGERGPTSKTCISFKLCKDLSNKKLHRPCMEEKQVFKTCFYFSILFLDSSIIPHTLSSSPLIHSCWFLEQWFTDVWNGKRKALGDSDARAVPGGQEWKERRTCKTCTERWVLRGLTFFPDTWVPGPF